MESDSPEGLILSTLSGTYRHIIFELNLRYALKPYYYNTWALSGNVFIAGMVVARRRLW